MSSQKFYIVISQTACDDPYYPPHRDTIGTYKSKEKAIEYARLSRKKTKKHSSPGDCYYVTEHIFDDEVDKKDYSSSESSDEEDDENIINIMSTALGITREKYKEDMLDKKRERENFEDEEKYFNENDKQYKQGRMVYVISRKRDKNEEQSKDT